METLEEIRKFIDEEFKAMMEPNGQDYHKLFEKVLQGRFSIYNHISQYIPKKEFKEELAGTMQEEYDRQHNNVDHPSHYTSHPSGTECIEITRHYCFSIGNAIKYLWRAGLKKEMGLEDREKEIEDLRKAIWYINDRIKQLSNGN